MKRLLGAVCIMLLTTAAVFAQSESTTEEENEDNVQYVYNKNYKGDQFLLIEMGPTFPSLDFPNDFVDNILGKGQLYNGGLGYLGYHYFLTDMISVGGKAGFGFNLTVGSNTLNYIPVFGEVAFHPVAGNFEFPVSAAVGFGWETYSKYTYFPALMVNAQAGAFYRINSSWGAGLNLGYLYLPEWTSSGYKAANIFTATVGVKYYF